MHRRNRFARRRLTRASIIKSITTIILTFILTPSATARDETPPRVASNIIMLLTDDQAAGTLGCEGNPIVRTPAIDRLAAEGVRFSRAYVVIPQCAPSRASLLTGRYPHEHGVLDNRTRATIEPSKTLPALLGQAGYRRGLIGKWHLQPSLEREPLFPDFEVSAVLRTGGQRNPYLSATVIWNGEQRATNRYLTDVLGDAALEFLDSADDERPFLLWLAFHAPHEPITAHPDFPYDPDSIPAPPDDPLDDKPEAQRRSAPHVHYRMKQPEELRRLTADYYSMISAVDHNVGRIVDRVRSAKWKRDTLVVFFSDNGWLMGEHRLYSKGPAAYEPLVRMPLIVWSAKEAPPSDASQPPRISDALVSSLDLYPTLLDAAGLAPPEPVPGSSLLPIVRGEAENLREHVFIQYVGKDEGTAAPLLAVVGRRYKYVRYLPNVESELYDLAEDPHELKNLAFEDDAAFSDPDGEPARLRAALETFMVNITRRYWE